MPELSRRRFIQAASLAPLAAMLPKRFIAEALAAPGTHSFAFFDPHQAEVVREATARLIPGPEDDPLEAGHPGAREANVVRYIDVLLGAFTFTPPRIHAGGPYSNRNGEDEDYMAEFVRLSAFQEASWRKRITALQKEYVAGIKALDAAAGGDFSKASANKQDSVLAGAGDFLDTLFTNAIEGFLAAPEYGGNAGGVGWKEISFHGDTQPRGWSPAEVTNSDGVDPVITDAVVLAVMAHMNEAALGIVARKRYGR